MDLSTRKNMFSQKSLFFPKTYSDSFPNTKYEVLTRKTEWDISKITLKNNDFQHFSLKLVSLWLTKETAKLKGFRIGFWSYLAQFFELGIHIWYVWSCLHMFLEKINILVKKYFFVSRGPFSVKKSVILKKISTLNRHSILTRFDQNPVILTLKST